MIVFRKDNFKVYAYFCKSHVFKRRKESRDDFSDIYDFCYYTFESVYGNRHCDKSDAGKTVV